MYPVSKAVEPEDSIGSAYGIGLSKAADSDEEVELDDCALLVERDLIGTRSRAHRHVDSKLFLADE